MSASPLPPTRAGRQALAAIEAAVDRGGVAPSLRELQEALGVSSLSGVHRVLAQLETRGWIVRARGHARAIRLIHRLSAPADLVSPLAALVERVEAGALPTAREIAAARAALARLEATR